MLMDMFLCSGFRTWNWRGRRRRRWRWRWRMNLRRILSFFTFSLWKFTKNWSLSFQVILIQNLHHLQLGEENFSKLFLILGKSLFWCHLLTVRISLSQSNQWILFNNITFTMMYLFPGNHANSKNNRQLALIPLDPKNILNDNGWVIWHVLINHLGSWMKEEELWMKHDSHIHMYRYEIKKE